MDKLLKVGGKGIDNNAHPIALTENGNVIAEKKWSRKEQKIFDNTFSSEAIYTTTERADITGGVTFTEVINRTGVPVDLILNGDVYYGNWARRLTDQSIRVTVPSTTSDDIYIITPDDLPELTYLTKLKFVVSSKGGVGNGRFAVTAVTKG